MEMIDIWRYHIEEVCVKYCRDGFVSLYVTCIGFRGTSIPFYMCISCIRYVMKLEELKCSYFFMYLMKGISPQP